MEGYCFNIEHRFLLRFISLGSFASGKGDGREQGIKNSYGSMTSVGLPGSRVEAVGKEANVIGGKRRAPFVMRSWGLSRCKTNDHLGITQSFLGSATYSDGKKEAFRVRNPVSLWARELLSADGYQAISCERDG